MAYYPKNKLLQIVDVQNEYLLYKQEGVSTAFVYRRYIYPKFHISLKTLYNYLATPAVKMLKELAVNPHVTIYQRSAQVANQPTLFDNLP